MQVQGVYLEGAPRTNRFVIKYVPEVPGVQKEKVGGSITPTERIASTESGEAAPSKTDFSSFEPYKNVESRGRARSRDDKPRGSNE